MHRLIRRRPTSMPDRAERDQDRGAILVITLVLCLVLGTVTVAMATFTTTALRASRVTEARSQRRTAADAGVRVGVQLLQLTGQAACNGSPTTMTVPPLYGATGTLTCQAGTANSAWTPYTLTATSGVGGGSTTAIATVQVPTVAGIPCALGCTVVVNSWAISS